MSQQLTFFLAFRIGPILKIVYLLNLALAYPVLLTVYILYPQFAHIASDKHSLLNWIIFVTKPLTRYVRNWNHVFRFATLMLLLFRTLCKLLFNVGVNVCLKVLILYANRYIVLHYWKHVVRLFCGCDTKDVRNALILLLLFEPLDCRMLYPTKCSR